jgi:hypothetical protein
LCGGPNFYPTLSAAITAASSGDVIYLKPAETYTGAFTAKTGITITTTGSLPAPGRRVSEAADAAQMPTITSSGGGASALTIPISTSNITLRGVRLTGGPGGYGDVITIGANDTTQQFWSEQPNTITIDQILITVHPTIGQKRGIAINGRNVSITNSACDGVNQQGDDSQCFWVMNTYGPVTITNNLCKGGTECVMVGGDQSFLAGWGAVQSTPTPTASVFTLGCYRNSTCAAGAGTRVHSLTDLTAMPDGGIGQLLACDIAGTRRHSYITAISGDQVTVSPAFPAAPSASADCRWGAVAQLILEHNYFTKDLLWRNGIVQAATGVTATASTASGSLAAGTYCYLVIATAPGEQSTTVYGARPAEQCAVLGATGKVTVAWSAVTNATGYNVWGLVSGGPTQFWSVTAPTVTYVDDGTAGTSGSLTSQPVSKWDLKNALELKACMSCTIRYNVFENHWAANQAGEILVVKSVNQWAGGTDPYKSEYTIVKDTTIASNVFRSAAGWAQIVGQEYESGLAIDKPAPITNLALTGNLVYDSSSAYGQSNYALNMQNGINGVTASRNTIVHTSLGLAALSGPVFTGTNLFENNLLVSNTYGFKGDGQNSGTSSLTAWNVTTSYNAIGGVLDSLSTWPSTGSSHNIYPSQATWNAQFTNVAGSTVISYALVGGSAYLTGASDGGRLGADIAALAAYETVAISGVPAGSGGLVPVLQNIYRRRRSE